MAKKVTHEMFVQRICDKYGEVFTVESEYRGIRHTVMIKHTECGFKKEFYPNNFKGKYQKCEGGLRYTPEQFNEKVYL